MFDFIHIKVIDIIDILLVGLLIYQVFKLIRGTAAISIFSAILLIYITWFIVKALNMNLLSTILGQVLGVGLLALIILFQQEIRRFLLIIGTKYINRSRGWRFLNNLFGKKDSSIEAKSVEELVQACKKMAETKTGALIVLSHNSSLEFIIETGDIVDAMISRRLIENIFFKNSPLHDGAMVIESNRIAAARCTLPISENPNIPANYGMRHRAALGVSEKGDVDVIVVSEETGGISFVSDGEIKTITDINDLYLSINSSYRKNEADNDKKINDAGRG